MPSMILALVFKIVPAALIGWLGYRVYKDNQDTRRQAWRATRESAVDRPKAPQTTRR